MHVTTDKAELDIDLIHRFLSEESYWARRIPRRTVELAIANSLCFAACEGSQQIGFARVVTDFAVYAYVGDVFVLSAWRGKGASKLLMKAIREHPSLQGLRRWHLLTRDAHRLYEQFGFRTIEKPDRHMEIAVVNPYGGEGM